MTGKDWTKSDNVDLYTRFEADEWKNPTMSLDVIADITAALYGYLKNEDLLFINENFRGADAKAMEREISARSSKAARNDTENELMYTRHRELHFRRMKYMQDYLFTKYWEPGAMSAGSSATENNGTATGRGN